MPYNIDFTHYGEHDFNKLPADIQNRIINKIKIFINSGTPLYFAKPLINLPPATHRFRVGKYRICFYIEGNTIIIDTIDKRSAAYRH